MAEKAAEFAKPFGGEEWAYVAGIVEAPLLPLSHYPDSAIKKAVNNHYGLLMLASRGTWATKIMQGRNFEMRRD